MAWKTEFSQDAERDLELIFDHLFDAYVGFGEAPDGAFAQAADRIGQIRQSAVALSNAPHRGTLRSEVAPGLRNVTIDRAIFWFDLDETREIVRVLAVFFGGQDHIRQMLARLLGGPDYA